MYEWRQQLFKELPGDFLDSVFVDPLLEEPALEDIAPPALHVGGDTLAEAHLVPRLCELPVEDVHDVEAVGRDQVDLGVAQLVAHVDVVLRVH